MKQKTNIGAFFEPDAEKDSAKSLVHDVNIIVPKVFLPFFNKASYKVAYGGRGSGKSWFFAY